MGKKKKSKPKKKAKLTTADAQANTTLTSSNSATQNNLVIGRNRLQNENQAAETQSTEEPVGDEGIHLAYSEGVRCDVDYMLRTVAATRKSFVSEEEWSMRKLWLVPEELLSDCEFIIHLTQRLVDDLGRAPHSVVIFIEHIMQSFENGGVPVSIHFHQNTNRAKDFALQGEFEKCKRYVKNVVQMIVERLKVATVGIPQEGRNRAEATSCYLKLRKARKQKMALLGWKIDFHEFMTSNWRNADKKATAPKAPGCRPKFKTYVNEDEPGAQERNAVFRKEFCTKLKDFVKQTAEAQKVSLQIDPSGEDGNTMMRWMKLVAERADNAMLIARVIAEARGWNDIVEDIDDAYEEGAERDNS